MHSSNDSVMSEMLREQSAPPGANQWYSRPAMVMQPARAGQGNRWVQREVATCCHARAATAGIWHSCI